MSIESSKQTDKSQTPPEKKKEKKKKVAVKPQRPPAVQLPILVELCFSIPVILILMTDFVIISFSYAAGTDWVTSLGRAMVATVVIGSLSVVVAYVVSTGALADAKAQMEKAQEEEQKSEIDSMKA